MRLIIPGVLLALLVTTLVATAPRDATHHVVETISLAIDDTAQGLPVPESLYGSNLPTWLGPAHLADSTFQELASAAGLTVMRMPGGSWSNGYDWRACEVDLATGCWGWAARPQDYIGFLRATGMQGMFTVNQNGTSQEAAALVAFFNGAVDDDQVIGVDVRGRDWGQVGDWAQLRTENGSPDSLYVKYWEIGNEVYGGTEGSGTDCTSAGWEDVWTCDGAEYVLGIGSGAERQEGYLEFRAAMQAVDPTILVGAVGVPFQTEWNNWGNEVIAAAGDVMDFYSVHHYAFWNPPASYAEALAAPHLTWSPITQDIQDAFGRHADGRPVPVAITEYNLFSVQERDDEQWMTRMVNAFYLADTLGQMAVNDIELATQWDFANGAAENGTDYGLISAETYERSPQYFVYSLWSRIGPRLLPVENPRPAATELSVYAGRVNENTITLLALNKTPISIDAVISLASDRRVVAGEADVVQAASLDAHEVTYNGEADPATDLGNAPSKPLTDVASPLAYSFDPYSITLLTLSIGSQGVEPTQTLTPPPDFEILLPIIID